MRQKKLSSLFKIGIASLIGFVIGIITSNLLLAVSEQSISVRDAFTNSPHSLANAIRISPGTDIQPVIDSSPPASIFLIEKGIHRQQSITPRDNDTFIGETGAILNGAVTLDDFRQEQDYWVARHPQLRSLERVVGGDCQIGFDRCNHPYDVYINNVPLTHVDSPDAVETNTWYFDYANNQLLIGSNPINQIVELSVVFHAFKGTASSVTIQNLIIEKYAGYGQMGAIRAQDTNSWHITENIVRLNSGAGITFGPESNIQHNRVMRNGQIGVSGQGNDVRIISNEIAYNNYANYNAAWEAGGTKFVATDNLVVRNNYVHHNNGPGLWTDIGNFNTLYESNLVLSNTGSGILHEISYDATIRHNILRFNLDMVAGVYLGGQIAISSSRNVDVYDNDVVTGTVGGNGIVILQQDRGEGRRGVYESRNNHVHQNTIVFLNTVGETAGAIDLPDADWFWKKNVFNENQYYGLEDDLALWGWQNQRLSWQDFKKATGTTGSYSTDIPLHAVRSPTWQELSTLNIQNN